MTRAPSPRRPPAHIHDRRLVCLAYSNSFDAPFVFDLACDPHHAEARANLARALDHLGS